MNNIDFITAKELASINPDKLKFIQNIFVDSKKLGEKEQMPYLLALLTKMKDKKISFTKEELNLIVTYMRENSTPQEAAGMERLIQMSSLF